MTTAIANYLIQSNLPPVPSAFPIYKSTQTTTTNEDTTTWTDLDIGVPHPKRLVIIAFYGGVANFTSASVNGIPCFIAVKNNAHECGILGCQVPNGTLGNLVLTCATSLRKAASIYVAYPNNWMPIDTGSDSATFLNDAVVLDIQANSGGFLIYAGCQHTATGNFTTTWSGTPPVVEDVDAQLEAAATYTMGHINITGASTSANDLTMAESVTGTKRLAVASWGPPLNVAA